MNPYKPHLTPKSNDIRTRDSFQNFAARVGINTDNQSTASSYGFNPISRNRLQLEWCYRGSWLAGVVVDCVAEDMTREGIEVVSEDAPDKLSELDESVKELQIWPALCEAIKWGRLYGGALGFMLVDGQDNATPLRIETVSKDQFKGVFAMDRWMCQPTLETLVTDFGPDLGKPLFYQLLPDTGLGLAAQKIHYSRLIRIEGLRLPYWQRITENGWGQSVLERLWDRMVAFDSSTLGASQMVYKAHLRTYAVDQLRDIISQGGEALDALLQQIAMMRRFQTNEGLTIMDTKDKFEAHQYNFSGLADIIMQFGMQLSGASQIPLVRLFGQSPSGLSATGESDLRNYYDGIKNKQEAELRPGLWKLYQLLYRSKFGIDAAKGFGIKFKPLWQMNEEQKGQVTNTRTASVVAAHEAQIIDRATAMSELKQLGDVTGAFTNIDDADIKKAKSDPAPSPEALGLELPAKPDAGPQAPGKSKPDENGKGRAPIRAVS